MPELPEIQRAASIIKQVANGRTIKRVEAVEDKIVYSGTTHDDFAKALSGRKVLDVRRYGKVLYMELDGEGPLPVLHFGMTGMIQIRNGPKMYYQTRSPDETKWPPLYMKFILIIASDSGEDTQIAFTDPRRLGRIRLCLSPMKEPPISALGFDPILSMPTLEDFCSPVRKRSCAIKSLLLDQSFSAGIGNWVADEVLYQSCIHPERPANTLELEELTKLHAKIIAVCQQAIELNADSSLFPENWLFKHRWNKGKTVDPSKPKLLLPNGRQATIKWVTVGGRTSAYVAELQSLRIASTKISTVEDRSESDLTPLSDKDSKPQASLKRKTEVQHMSLRSRRRKNESSDIP